MNSSCRKSSPIDLTIWNELRLILSWQIWTFFCLTLRLRYRGLRLRVIPGDEAPEDSARVDETGAGELGKEGGDCHQEGWGPHQNKSHCHTKGKWLASTFACKESWEVSPEAFVPPEQLAALAQVCRRASGFEFQPDLSSPFFRHHQSSRALKIHPHPGSPVDPQNTKVEPKAWALGRKRRRRLCPRRFQNLPGRRLFFICRDISKTS